MQLGSGPIGKYAITEKAGAGVAAAVLAIIGSGAFLATSNPVAGATIATSGAGVFTSVGQSTTASALTSSGVGSASYPANSFGGSVLTTGGAGVMVVGGTMVFNSTTVFAGRGGFAPTPYVFFSDVEVLCVHYELRSFGVPPENRTAIVTFENRIYEVPSEYRTGGTSGRKRIC